MRNREFWETVAAVFGGLLIALAIICFVEVFRWMAPWLLEVTESWRQ